MRAVLRQRPDLTRAQLTRTRRLMDQHVRGSRVTGYLLKTPFKEGSEVKRA